MKNELLSVFDDSDSLAILIALYHWNPRTVEEVSEGVSLSKDIVKKRLISMINIGLIEKSEHNNEFEITSFGKIYIESLGINRNELNEKIDKELQRV